MDNNENYVQPICAILFVTMLLTSNLLTLSCNPALNQIRDPIVRVNISDEVTLDEDEREFVFEKAFKPSKQVNKICIAYKDILTIQQFTAPPRFEDSTPWIVTINLFDMKGNVYVVDSITKNRQNYLCLVPKNYKEWLDISSKNVSFVRMTIRSNKAVSVSKIEWETYNAWDLNK